MKDIQYKVVDKTNGKTKGWIVGKTLNRELILNLGTKTFLFPLTEKNLEKFEVIKLEVVA